MKIVFVLHYRLDRNAGAAGVLFALADRFVAAGHEVATISHDGIGRLPSLLREMVFPFYAAAKLLAHHGDADVIEAATGDCWLYYLARRRRTRPLGITFSHGLYRPLHDRLMQERARGAARVSWKYWLFRGSVRLWEEALSMRVADLVYVLNEEERRFATDAQKVDPARVKIVRNGLGEHFRSRSLVASQMAPPPRRTRIVQVGSYEERKGIRATVAATTRLMQARPAVRMAFLGTVCRSEDVHADYPAALRDRVAVTPRFDNAALPDLLAAYSIFVMPSTYEAFGIAPLEAMACGLVPIVTDIAGPAEYIRDGVNGLVVPVDAPEALEQAIGRLIDDDGLYARLRAGALATVRTFDWDQVARERLADYEHFGRIRRAAPASRSRLPEPAPRAASS